MKDDYKLLFSPGKLGRVTAKNRCVMTAMMTGFPGVTGGDADERVIRYYEERAAGGTGGSASSSCWIVTTRISS